MPPPQSQQGLRPPLVRSRTPRPSVVSLWWLRLSGSKARAQPATHVPSVLGPPSPGEQHSDLAQRTACPFQRGLLPAGWLVGSLDVFSTLGKRQLDLRKDGAAKAKPSRTNVSSEQFLPQIPRGCPIRQFNLRVNSGCSGQKNLSPARIPIPSRQAPNSFAGTAVLGDLCSTFNP